MKTELACHTGMTLAALLLTVARADAFASYAMRDARITIAGYRFGLVDMAPGWNSVRDNGAPPFTLLDVGPLGTFNVPFDTASVSYAAWHALPTLVRP